MKKEIQTRGIVLKIYPLGETSQKIILLSDKGLLHFISHGTQKSLKKGKLFTLLCADFHLSDKKGSWTLLESNNPLLFENLSTDIAKFYTASILTEIALKSYSDADLFPIFLETLETLNAMDSKLSFYLLLQFWWRWIAESGEQADLDTCSSCGKTLTETYFFAHLGEGFLCGNCAKNHPQNSLYPLNQGIRRYLEVSLKDSLKHSLKARLDNQSLENLGTYLCQKVQNILKWELKSWRAGKDLILPPTLRSHF